MAGASHRVLQGFTAKAAGVVLLCWLSMVASAADYANRKVVSVLDELRSSGLVFIYNVDIVPPNLPVASEPAARSGIALANEILAAHSLKAEPVASGVYAIVRVPFAVKPAAAAPIESKRPERPELDEIVVISSLYKVANSEPSSVQLTQAQVENTPRLADDPLRALQRLPGSTTNGFSSVGSTRGGAPNETALVLDGLRLYEPFHLKDFLSPISVLDPRIVGDMRYYAGGYSVQYGDRMSAIIDATTVRHDERRYLEAGLTLFHLNGLYARDIVPDRTNMLVAARRSNLDILSQFAESKFGEPDYADGFARIEHRISDATRLKVEALISSDDIDVLKEGGIQRAQASYNSTYAWATLEHDWNESFDTRLIVSYTDIDNRREGTIESPGVRTGSVRDSRSFHVAGLRVDNHWSAQLGERPILNDFGVEVRRLSSRYAYSSALQVAADYPFVGSPAFSVLRESSPTPAGYESSAYWESRFEVFDRLTLQAGLRADTQTYDVSGDPEQWSPRVGLLYATKGRTELRASWGRFYQAQGINELQVEDGVTGFYPAQHADHSIVSVQHSYPVGLDIRVEAYRKDYKQLNQRFENVLDSHVLLPELEYDRVSIRPTRARIQGVELLAQLHPTGSWSGWFSYSWSRAEDRVESGYVPRNWDQTHAFNLGIVWTRGPWVVALTDSYHTGWPTTNVIRNMQSPNPEFVLGDRNADRLAAFNSLDMRIARTFAFSHSVLEVFIEGSNVLDDANQCCVSFTQTASPNGPTVTRKVDYWLPLIPSAGILWRH